MCPAMVLILPDLAVASWPRDIGAWASLPGPGGAHRPSIVSPCSGIRPTGTKRDKRGLPLSSTIMSVSVPGLNVILFPGKSPCQEACHLVISAIRSLDFDLQVT